MGYPQTIQLPCKFGTQVCNLPLPHTLTFQLIRVIQCTVHDMYEDQTPHNWTLDLPEMVGGLSQKKEFEIVIFARYM